jgi:hypothetical protein
MGHAALADGAGLDRVRAGAMGVRVARLPAVASRDSGGSERGDQFGDLVLLRAGLQVQRRVRQPGRAPCSRWARLVVLLCLSSWREEVTDR